LKNVVDMNKPISLATVTIALLMGVAFVFPALEIAHGQYVTEAPSSVEEQLELAKSKINNAKQTGAYGSGTPMLGTNVSETVIMIVVLTAIFGGVAAAFFVKGRAGRKEAATS
jgi:disulfide bond formation protein DsbB